jgi:hypothetical protein
LNRRIMVDFTKRGPSRQNSRNLIIFCVMGEHCTAEWATADRRRQV